MSETTFFATKQYLEENGYVGLINFREGCCCNLDNFAPFGKPEADCVAGYRVECSGCEKYDFCIVLNKWHKCDKLKEGNDG